MMKSKLIAIAASAALVAAFGLSACGGQAASSSASTSSANDAVGSSEAASSAAATSSSAADASVSSAATSSDSTSAEDMVISWQGALVDGTLVDFICSDDEANGGFVLTQSGSAEPKRWLGSMTTSADGTVTITDDQTKDTISFTRSEVAEDGAVTIDVEGYGKGAIVPMTAADWQRVAEAEELAKNLGTVVNWVGAFEDGSLVVYMDNEDGTEAALAIGSAEGSDLKTWTGKVTAADGGKVTITDDKSNEAITITVTKSSEDGTLTVEADGYGKGLLVGMTVADYVELATLQESSSTK